jgi:citrate synthase
MAQEDYLNAAEAAAMLGISRGTLYAYVSRGLVRSEAHPDAPRKRRYATADVARLARRKAQRARPERAASEALHWGAPVLDSAITRIQDGQCHYRGYEIASLARRASIEAVAGLLWSGELGIGELGVGELRGGELESGESRGGKIRAGEMQAGDFGTITAFDPANRIAPAALIPHPQPLTERMHCALALASAEDISAWQLGAEHLPAVGARIMRLLTGVAATQSASRAGDPASPDALAAAVGMAAEQGIARALAAAWGVNAEDAALLDAALVLSADQELNASSFTVRCVASAGSNAYASIQAGLAALQGVKHGGHTARVAALLREVGRPEGVRLALRERLQRGEPIPGFGHPLYPEGDPRGRALLEMLAEAHPGSPALRLADALVPETIALTGRHPTIDFGLVTLAGVLGLPAEAPFALFAIGRSAGWIAHAIEQVEDGRLIRPRARYVGRLPVG